MPHSTHPSPTRKILFAGGLFLFSALTGSGATLHSIDVSPSNWTSTACWSTTSGGTSCGCTPVSGDNVYVETTMSLNSNRTGGNGISGTLTITTGSLLSGPSYSMDIKNGGYLYVYGDLDVNDLTFANGSHVLIASGATVNVYGNFSNNNNSNNVVVDGTLNIYGNAYNGNGGVISGTGTINATNPFTGAGTFGSGLTLNNGPTLINLNPTPPAPTGTSLRAMAYSQGVNSAPFEINVFPSPATLNNINVSVKGMEGKDVLVVLTDLLGQQFYSKVVMVENGDFTFALDPSESIAPGIYLVIASSNDKFRSKKITIQ